jgi:hypothetical protein
VQRDLDALGLTVVAGDTLADTRMGRTAAMRWLVFSVGGLSSLRTELHERTTHAPPVSALARYLLARVLKGGYFGWLRLFRKKLDRPDNG